MGRRNKVPRAELRKSQDHLPDPERPLVPAPGAPWGSGVFDSFGNDLSAVLK